MAALTPQERVARRITTTPDGCWAWNRIGSDGYARITVNHRRWQAARWVYTNFVGPIPEGLTIDHLCRNIRCVNPEHLEPVSIQENLRRAAEARRVHKAAATRSAA